jgi:hypothetical protein
MKTKWTESDFLKPVVAQKENFDTLKRAFSTGNIGLIEVTLKSTGEKLACVCAIVKNKGEYVVTPFALMMNGNPYELLEPPHPDEINSNAHTPAT